MHLELDDIVQHPLDLGVEFLAECVGAEGQLFVSIRTVREDRLKVSDEEGNLLDVCVHLTLLHQLHALGQASAHLRELLFHLLDLSVRSKLLSCCDLQCWSAHCLH